MRIAVSADDKHGLESIVSPHFGRCPHFTLVDVEEGQVKAVRDLDNPFFSGHEPGQVPGFIASQSAQVMLTGGMGQRAVWFFQQHGIESVTGAYGSVRQAVQSYLGGQLRGTAPCAESLEHAKTGHDAHHQEPKSETERLQEEADLLRQQLTETTARLDRLSRQ
jgi:predicted Fe-Mo cluster-binding NifX family protein